MSILDAGSPLVVATAHMAANHLTFLEAGVVGLIQGVTELFPVSSLGHNVLIPALIGGQWQQDLNVAGPESPYLAFIVGLHVATAIALLIYFWRDWVRIIGGFFRSLKHMASPPPGEDRFEFRTVEERMAWLVILATIPVGLVGVLFEHEFRVIFGKPIAAAVFLTVNGVILYAGERFRRKSSIQADEQVAAERELVLAGPTDIAEPASHVSRGHHAPESSQRAVRDAELAEAAAADRRLSQMGYGEAIIIGCAQILALLAGISRDGVTMVAGMFRGLSRADAARFAFLLATPVILAAGALKIPDLMGPLGNGIRGQVLFGSVLSGVGAYVSVRFLTRYFAKTRTLTPFAVYCLVVGVGSTIYLGLIR
ncbi:MAG TPA: undecaprenyl-diphosphate phosphatase [Streptosporangiaceae bacterium]|nr:undecaprenyl-diphosphate phosphatase [Streptosporangiaceae bacterium]